MPAPVHKACQQVRNGCSDRVANRLLWQEPLPSERRESLSDDARVVNIEPAGQNRERAASEQVERRRILRCTKILDFAGRKDAEPGLRTDRCRLHGGCCCLGHWIHQILIYNEVLKSFLKIL